MLQLKYASPQIRMLSENDLYLAVDILMLKIHVITGWTIPSDGPTNEILTDQLAKKLKEDYDILNLDEIEYAFRSSGTTVEDWGKEMNLNLVDKVLQPFVEKRLDLGRKEEAAVPPPAQRIYTDEEILNERRGELEMAFQCMRNGRVPVIHVYFPDILVKDGFIEKPEDMSEFFVQALGKGTLNLYRLEKNDQNENT